MATEIPINKGNYTMETPEREAAFHAKLGAGWEKEYEAYRKNWNEYPKKQFLSDYPLLVDLELSTVCNLRCPMCYTITEHFKKRVKVGFLDFALFKRIVDEICDKVPALRLSLRGEPTLHPKFFECVSYAKQKGVREISMLTNGSKLSCEFIEKLVEIGLDWLVISVDGLNEKYESVRRPLKFKDTLQKIKNLKLIKQQKKSTKPVVKVQGIWPAIKDNPEAFYNTFIDDVDLIAFNPLIDYLGKDENIVYVDNFLCPQHYQRLVIGSDGQAMMCSNDEEGMEIIGDANQQTIHQIWHGERLGQMREKHRQQNGFKSIPVCKKCYLPRQTEDVEKAAVNGREFIIKNYVNRRQVIGT